jgi:hypothetical protein
MQKEMKSKLVSGKACYHSVQNSSRIWWIPVDTICSSLLAIMRQTRRSVAEEQGQSKFRVWPADRGDYWI